QHQQLRHHLPADGRRTGQRHHDAAGAHLQQGFRRFSDRPGRCGGDPDVPHHADPACAAQQVHGAEQRPMTNRAGTAKKALAASWRGGWQLAIWIAVAVNAFPFYWMIVTSFKDKEGLYEIPPTLVPGVWTLENYRLLFSTTEFSTYFLNSVIIATSSTAL